MAVSVDALFVALADPIRRGLFETLLRAPASVGELAAPLPVTRAAVSQHLALLLNAGLVEVGRSGRHRIYRARAQPMQVLEAYARAPSSRHNVAPARVEPTPGDPFGAALAKWQAESPHIDPSALAMLMYFAQIGQYVFRSNEQVARKFGLRFSDITVLGALRRLGAPYESTPSRLARTFWITLPGMTKRLSRLEAMGLVRRKPDPDDGRSIRLGLTPKGLKLLRTLISDHQPPEYDALLKLSLVERRHLSCLLSRVLAEIDRAHGHPRPAYSVVPA